MSIYHQHSATATEMVFLDSSYRARKNSGRRNINNNRKLREEKRARKNVFSVQ